MEKAAKKLISGVRVPEDMKLKYEQKMEASGLNHTELMNKILRDSLTDKGEEEEGSPEKNPSDKEKGVVIPGENLSNRVAKALANIADSLERITTSKEELLSDELYSEIREEIEEEIENKYLVLKLTPEQKQVFTDLLMYRNEKGHKCSSCAEELFTFMLEETFTGFNKKNPEFMDKFKEAYSEHLSDDSAW